MAVTERPLVSGFTQRQPLAEQILALGLGGALGFRGKSLVCERCRGPWAWEYHQCRVQQHLETVSETRARGVPGKCPGKTLARLGGGAATGQQLGPPQTCISQTSSQRLCSLPQRCPSPPAYGRKTCFNFLHLTLHCGADEKTPF